jgi:hypothetical protein
MEKNESIDCIAQDGKPVVFYWRDTVYNVTRVLSSWCKDEEWWNSCFFTDTKFWLVTVQNGEGFFELRHNADGSWWLSLDRTHESVAV